MIDLDFSGMATFRPGTTNRPPWSLLWRYEKLNMNVREVSLSWKSWCGFPNFPISSARLVPGSAKLSCWLETR